MDNKNTSKNSADKISNAEESCFDVSASGPDISNEIKRELDRRLQNLKEGKSKLYTWEEVKSHIQTLR